MKTSLAVDWREVTSLLDWIRVHWIASGLSLGGIVSAAGAAVKGLKWFRDKSLRTLETAGAVLEVKKGEWCLGNRTQKDILDEQWGGGGRFGGNRFNRS